jgi:ABC-2 type transport system permease protein
MSSGALTGTAVRGARAPSRGDAARRFTHLTYTLAITEWKLRFFGSALGYLWTLARPLMFFGVLYVVFSHVAKVGDTIPHYEAYLLFAIVLFTFFAEATGGAVESLVARESLLRKVRFPRIVVPLSVVLTALFNLGMNLIAVAIFLIATGLHPGLRWLELPLLVGLLMLLASGTALLLSVLYVRYRDVAPMWEVLSQMLFYGSPIFYTIDFYGDFEQVMACTPIPMILTQMRHALIDPSAPSAADAAGGAAYLLIPIGICFATFLLGLVVFRRAAPRLAEEL